MEAVLIDYLSKQLATLLKPDDTKDAALVQEGMALFMQNLVYEQQTNEETAIAEVQDLTPHHVELNFLFAQVSTCSCRAKPICQHMMAVFFFHYSEMDSVSNWVADWMRQKPSISDLPIQRASDVFAKKKELEHSYIGWKQFVVETFQDRLAGNIGLPSYVLEERIHSYLSFIKSKMPIEPEWKHLYRFTTLFCTLAETMSLLELHRNESAVVRVFYNLGVDLTEELFDMTQALSRQVRPFSFDEFIDGLRTDMTKLLDGAEFLEFERVDLYREVWTYLFTNAHWRAEEVARLEAELDGLLPKTTQERIYVIATIHLALLTNEDASHYMKRLEANSCPYFYYWLNMLTDDRALPYIDWIISHVGEFLTQVENLYERVDFVRTLTRPISEWCSQNKKLDLLERFYRATLPHNHWVYANFLFKEKQYKKWVEMHIFSNINIDFISPELIKTVIDENPAYMLPLYYHAVQEKVSLKNRSAYKQAAKYLKKIRALHKKLKQEQKFESYLDYVIRSTKRLRAFQEELKRSKLIDV